MTKTRNHTAEKFFCKIIHHHATNSGFNTSNAYMAKLTLTPDADFFILLPHY